MMEVTWAPLLGALSVLFDEYTDPRLVRMCLQGFTASAQLTSQVRGGGGGLKGFMASEQLSSQVGYVCVGGG